MTFLQANAEAVTLHYRLADPLAAATAITAYLMLHGSGQPVSPGVSAGQPVFPERLRELKSSVVRGRRLYMIRCRECHFEPVIAPSVAAFPRILYGKPQGLEKFLADHRPSGELLPWKSQATADLTAYLVWGLATGHADLKWPGEAQKEGR
jgi:hypothetical protein